MKIAADARPIADIIYDLVDVITDTYPDTSRTQAKTHHLQRSRCMRRAPRDRRANRLPYGGGEVTSKQQKHARALKQIFEQLNQHLAAQGLFVITYKHLGEQLDLGKSAISNLLNGTYNSDTAGKYLTRIAEALDCQCKIFNFTPELTRPAKAALCRTGIPACPDADTAQREAPACPLPTTVRVSTFGFFRYNGHHYYAGSHANCTITVEPGAEPDTVTVPAMTNCFGATVTTLRPIDPKHSPIFDYGTSTGARRGIRPSVLRTSEAHRQ
jgi:hypothetical protein